MNSTGWVVPGLALLSMIAAAPAAQAAGVVGTGTPGSCTEAALRAAMAADGVVTFNCGAAPATIVVTTPLATGWHGTASSITIDGAGRVTLSGGSRRQIFTFTGGRVALSNLNLLDASGVNGGAILSAYTALTVNHCTFSGNRARHGAAIYNSGGTVTVNGGSFTRNQASDAGGAIYSTRGEGATATASMIIQSAAIERNQANEGGAVYLESGELRLASVGVRNNLANRAGGGIYVAAGHLAASRSAVDSNRAQIGAGLHNSFGATVDLAETEVSFNVSTAEGGGIYNLGHLSLTRGSIDGNSTPSHAGGLYTSGLVFGSGVTLAGNRSGADGGAIYVTDLGEVHLFGSTLFNNSAVNGGAGMAFGTGIWIDQSVVKANTASNQGGAFATSSWTGGRIVVSRSTLSGNRAMAGGAIYSGRASAPVTRPGDRHGFDIRLSTVANNSATGGPASLFSEMDGVVQYSIVAGDGRHDNCGGSRFTITSSIQYPGTSCPGAEASDPRLGPLAFNGGTTETHALMPGSPAIDRGCAGFVTEADQRGVSRPQDGNGDGRAECDWGAFERRPGAAP